LLADCVEQLHNCGRGREWKGWVGSERDGEGMGGMGVRGVGRE